MSAEGAGVGAGGAFTLAEEVWHRGWKVLVVSGCERSSLFKPILSVTAGRRRASEANRADGRKSMELQETSQRSHSHSSAALYTSA